MKIKIDGVGKYLEEFEYTARRTNAGNFMVTVLYYMTNRYSVKFKKRKAITYLLIPDMRHSLEYMEKIFDEISEIKCDFKLSKDKSLFNTIYLDSEICSGVFTGFIIK